MPSHTLVGDLVTIATLPVPSLSISYRPVTHADRDPLAALYVAAYPPGVAVNGLAEACADVDATFAGEYGNLWWDASLVAVNDTDVVGSIPIVRRSPWDPELDCPFIIELFVAPHARGAGIGTALLGLSTAACLGEHGRRIALRTGDGTSDHAHRLYDRAAMRPISEDDRGHDGVHD